MYLALWRLVAYLRRTYRAIDFWLSARYPMAWTTRVAQWVPIGALLSIAVWRLTSRRSLSLDALPTLEILQAESYVCITTVGIACLVVVIGAARRTTTMLSLAHQGTLAAWIAVALIAVSAPCLVYGRTLLSRIDSIATPVDTSYHRQHANWSCRGYLDKFFADIDTNRERIKTDLARFGMVTDFEVIVDSACGRDVGSYSLSVRGEREPKTDPKTAPKAGRTSRIHAFTSGAATAEAARLFVATGVGPGPLVPGLASLVMIAAMIALATTALIGWRPVLIGTVVALRHRLHRWKSWRPQVVVRWDEQVARRVPLVWSSRIHSGLLFIALPAIVIPAVAVGALPVSPGIASSVIILALILACRTQEVRGNVSGRAFEELGVFVIHASVIFAVSWLTFGSTTQWPSQDDLDVMMWGSLFLAAGFQATRSSSVIHAVVALSAAASTLLIIALAGAAMGIQKDRPVGVELAFVLSCLYLFTTRRGGRNIRLALQRTLVASLQLLSPLFSFTLVLVFSKFDTPSVARTIWTLAICLITVLLCLHQTAGARSSLKNAAR